MKTKQTIITHGNGSRVVAVVEGKLAPSVRNLLKMFYQRYSFPDYTVNKPTRDLGEVQRNIHKYAEGMNAAQDDGLDRRQFDYAEAAAQFVQWLVREHGYRIVEINEMHVP